MEYKITERGAEIITSDKFDLKNTFDCGQCFRWNENDDGSYSGIVKNKKATVRRIGNTVIIDNCT